MSCGRRNSFDLVTQQTETIGTIIKEARAIIRIVLIKFGEFVCLFVLLLYIPSQQLWSWRDGQFT